MTAPRFASLLCALSVFYSAISTSTTLRLDAADKTAPSHFAEEIFRGHLDILTSEEFAGRRGDGGEKTAEYLREAFKKLKLQPMFGEEYFQEVPEARVNDAVVSFSGRNVGAILPGSDPALKDEIIIIGAHYDHLGRADEGYFPGADDNASGVSMLLEVARVLSESKEKPKRTIAFIGFDQEERMLWGSRWFVAHPPWPLERVKCLLVADMIGRSLGNLDLDMVFVLGSEYSPELVQALDAVHPPDRLRTARLGVDLIGVRSDYGPFWNEQIPFLFFSTGEHPDYHQQTDLPERIDYEQVANVSRLVHGLAVNLANRDDAPAWNGDVTPNLEEVKTVRKIVELLLEKQEQKPLGASQLLLLGHIKVRTQQILDKGEMTEGERTWLMRVSQLLLFSVL